MNGKIRIRHIYKATELKRFNKLEGKHHHMGKTHSGGDTMRIVFEDGKGKWLALMGGATSSWERRHSRPPRSCTGRRTLPTLHVRDRTEANGID